MTQKANLAGSGMSSDVYARHYEGVTDMAIERAREGVNDRCVECDAGTLSGGLRCLDCFSAVARLTTPKMACGTDPGYRRHLRRGETPCAGCRAARAEYNRQAAAAKRRAA